MLAGKVAHLLPAPNLQLDQVAGNAASVTPKEIYNLLYKHCKVVMQQQQQNECCL
ncbi:hypothetical protein CBOM_03514 [Ceraceosorus bombacis]|uniref:Uncharacterized protein n=1 Tax=Ceraceosorus bombacis TaxID=401625 RepID=A0A0P1BG79_9BASI|nr:hypothetical protein CBOM_03514 [Ceraceosorus bombacis]